MLRAKTTKLPAILRRVPFNHRAGDPLLSAAVLVVTGLTLGGMSPLLRNADWWWQGLFVGAVVLGVTAALRTARMPALLVALAGAVTLGIVSVASFAASTAILGFIPTAETLSLAEGLRSEAVYQILVGRAPIAPREGLVALLVLGTGLLALLLDTIVFALRMPALTGLLITGVYLTPGLIAGQDANLWIFIALTSSWLFLLHRADRHRRQLEVGLGVSLPSSRGGLGVVVGALSIITAMLLPVFVPALVADPKAEGIGPNAIFGSGINPILALGEHLRRPEPVPALSYQTDAGHGLYLKITELDDFTGRVWIPSNVGSRPMPYAGRNLTVPGLDPTFDTVLVRTEVRMANVRTPDLPVPYPTVQVSGLNGDWDVQDSSLRYTSDTANAHGQVYVTTSVTADVTADQVRAAPDDNDLDLVRFLSLPTVTPESIGQIAREVTAEETTDYDRALALQSYFRAGDFTYSETAPVDENYDGTGVEVLEKFLEVKQGYCVHFASAMAVMARELQIPSRIAVGYAPGVKVSGADDGYDKFAVSSDNLHAWPELYISGIGWTSFEPTPGRGIATRFQEAGVPGSGGGAGSGGITPNGQAPVPEGIRDDAGAAGDRLGGATVQNLITTAVITLIVVLVLLTPFLVRRWRRWSRLRRFDTSHAPIGLLWDELLDSARDQGFPVDPAETPRATVARLRRWRSLDSTALATLLELLERERFGPGSALAGEERQRALVLLAALEYDMTGVLDRSDRIRIALVPRSLLAPAAPRSGLNP